LVEFTTEIMLQYLEKGAITSLFAVKKFESNNFNINVDASQHSARAPSLNPP
jgi:hypothetical protein